MIDYAVQAKQAERDKLSNDVQEFLSSGGKIEVLPAYADKFEDFSESYWSTDNGKAKKPGLSAAGGR